MTRIILAIVFAIAQVSTLQAQVPPLPPPPPPAAIAPSSPFAQKFEYEFVTKPRGTDAFKKLLKERGKDGWEYVGLIPDGDELIFKKAQSGAMPMLIPGVAVPPAIGIPGARPLVPPTGLPGIPPIKDLNPPK